MPKIVEDIVARHRARPRWPYHLAIRDLFCGEYDDFDAQARIAAPRIVVALEELRTRMGSAIGPDVEPDEDLSNLIDAFAAIVTSQDACPSPQERFNAALERLYDFGDRHGVWIG